MTQAFRRVGANGVTSTAGFSVWTTRRWSVEYREGARHLELDVEYGRDPNTGQTVAYLLSSIAVWHSTGVEELVVGPVERGQIVANVRDALAFMGIRLIVGE